MWGTRFTDQRASGGCHTADTAPTPSMGESQTGNAGLWGTSHTRNGITSYTAQFPAEKVILSFTTHLIAFSVIIGKSFQNLIFSICEQTCEVQPEFMSRRFESTHSYANIFL